MPLKKARVDVAADSLPMDAAPPLDALLDTLEHPDPRERHRAAVGLEAFAEAVEAVLDRLEREDDAEVRAALVIAVLRHPSVGSAERLAEMIRSDRPGLRTVAVDTLRQMPDVGLPALSVKVRDPDPDVRILAVNTLQVIPDPSVESLLVERLADEQDVNVVGAIFEALLELGGPDCVDAVEQARDRFDDPFVGFAADAVVARARGSAS